MRFTPTGFVRQSDRPIWFMLLAIGIAMIGAAVVLRLQGMISETTATSWVGIAAFVARPDKVLDLIRARRARQLSGGTDGEETSERAGNGLS